MIEIIDFTRRFGSYTAVDRMNLNIEAGCVFGLLGPNGAGKTTTVKSIVGAIKPSSGKILINKKDVNLFPVEVKSIIGFVPENPVVFKSLTGLEYLYLVGKLYHIENATLEKKINDILGRFDLTERAGEQIIAYSKGMVQKLVIASAFLHNPSILILDEPLTGLDAKSVAILKQVITSFASRGKTVVFCSHILEIVEKLCDRMAILHNGRILSTGTSWDIIEQTKCKTLEEAFIKLTGETDITKEAADIVSSLE